MLSDKIPAVPFMSIVRLYAQAKGLRFFTLADRLICAEKYRADAERLN